MSTLSFLSYERSIKAAEELCITKRQVRILNILVTSAVRNAPNGVITPLYTRELKRAAEQAALLLDVDFPTIADPVWILHLRRAITQQHWVYSRYIASMVQRVTKRAFVGMKSANEADDADFTLVAPTSAQLNLLPPPSATRVDLYLSAVGPDAPEPLKAAVLAAARFADSEWDSDGYLNSQAE